MYTDKPTLIHIQGDNAAEMTPCIAYYRVSTDKQGRSGLGLEAQRKAVADFARSRSWLITKEFTEVESGKKNDRPCMAEAIEEAKKIKGKLVIAKLDRLARNVHFISGLMETRVDFVVVDMPNADKFMLHIFSAMAEEEGKRIRANGRAQFAACNFNGQVIKSDWTQGTARLVEDQSEIDAMYRAFVKKYGLIMVATNFFSRLSGRFERRAIIAMDIPAQ